MDLAIESGLNQRFEKRLAVNSVLVSLDSKQKLFQGFLPMLSIKLQGRSCGRAIQKGIVRARGWGWIVFCGDRIDLGRCVDQALSEWPSSPMATATSYQLAAPASLQCRIGGRLFATQRSDRSSNMQWPNSRCCLGIPLDQQQHPVGHVRGEDAAS
jgi:hypothetical protein